MSFYLFGGNNFIFVGNFKVTGEKRRIWIRMSVVRICGSGADPDSGSVPYQNVKDPEHSKL